MAKKEKKWQAIESSYPGMQVAEADTYDELLLKLKSKKATAKKWGITISCTDEE